MSLTMAGATALSAGIAATASAGTAIAGGKANARGVREARRARDWQTSEREAMQDWQLQQWNRENEYNSPEAQAARLQAAGYSPLAAMNGMSAGEAAHMEAPNDPGTSLPQISNPMESAQGGFMQAARDFLDYKRLQNETQKANAESEHLHADAMYKFSLKATEDQLRQRRFTMLGVQIELGGSQKKLTDKQYEQAAQAILESEQRIKEMMQYMRESNSRIDLNSWRKYAESQKLPHEVNQLIQGAILANQQALTEKALRPWKKEDLKWKSYNDYLNYQDHHDYRSTGLYGKDIYNRSKALEFDMKGKEAEAAKSQGSVKNKYLMMWDNAMDSIGKLTGLSVQAFQGYMFLMNGASNKARLQLMEESTQNPNGAVGNDPVYNQFFQ